MVEGQPFGLTCWRLTPVDLHLFQVFRRASGEALSGGDTGYPYFFDRKIECSIKSHSFCIPISLLDII